MSDTPRTDAETVASLLHTIALIREAAGCGGEVMLSDLPAFVNGVRYQRDEDARKVSAIEEMGYEWRWTRSIDENGEQVGAWVMLDAAEADANNERFGRTDGE